jgi:hypothetical protein
MFNIYLYSIAIIIHFRLYFSFNIFIHAIFVSIYMVHVPIRKPPPIYREKGYLVFPPIIATAKKQKQKNKKKTGYLQHD